MTAENGAVRYIVVQVQTYYRKLTEIIFRMLQFLKMKIFYTTFQNQVN